jgi:hypothetical protein
MIKMRKKGFNASKAFALTSNAYWAFPWAKEEKRK